MEPEGPQMMHMSSMLDKQGYMHPCTHTNRQYLLLFHSNNDLQMHLSVVLYVHCVSCLCLITHFGT
jgi:hypothetical protein